MVSAAIASVIPGRCEASNYNVQLHIGESRDSGSGPSDHPGMTEDGDGAALENVMRRTVLAALTALLTFGSTSAADKFPSHPITIIVPFAAGGPSDAMMRILAERMKVTLGEPLLIENVTGAGGSLGVGRTVRSAPDGYTVGFGHLGTNVANGAIYKLGYDLVTDLEPVVLLPSNPMIIVSKT